MWTYCWYSDPDPNAPCPWRTWYDAQNGSVKGRHDDAFRFLESRPQWNGPHAKKIGKLVEIRLRTDVQHRLIGFYLDQLGYDAVSDLGELKKFADPSYRESYLDSHIKSSIAYQIQELRKKLGFNQTDFGALIGMPQSFVSRLEKGEQGGVNINTLLKIAHRLGIALSVRFIGYEAVLAEDVSPSGLNVESIDETLNRRVATTYAAAKKGTLRG
jgi:transcriptional regulator with XRE-family HTH domain